MTAWSGRLREVLLRVPDPDSAAPYFAELLSGVAVEGAVELGSGTCISLEQGAPGFVAATLESTTADEGTLSDPDGNELRIVAADGLAPPDPGSEPSLGHLTFQSSDPLRAQSFYEGLGFHLSDGLGEGFRWLRCNPVHHTVAFSRAPTSSLHHIGIEVADRGALIAACDRLASLDHTIEYGPGRHLVGNNIFVYFLDRHGIRFELFCELERVAADSRPPRIHTDIPREKSVNIWGPQPPESFRTGIRTKEE